MFTKLWNETSTIIKTFDKTSCFTNLDFNWLEKSIKKCHGLVNSKAIKVVDLVAFESKVLIVFQANDNLKTFLFYKLWQQFREWKRFLCQVHENLNCFYFRVVISFHRRTYKENENDVDVAFEEAVHGLMKMKER